MNNQSVNSGKQQKQRDLDLAAAGIAMKRAAQIVHERTKHIGPGVMALKDDCINKNVRLCACIIELGISIKRAESLNPATKKACLI